MTDSEQAKSSPSIPADIGFELRGNLWSAKALSVCMAYDAFRIALGGEPTTFTKQEVLLWLTILTQRP